MSVDETDARNFIVETELGTLVIPKSIIIRIEEAGLGQSRNTKEYTIPSRSFDTSIPENFIVETKLGTLVIPASIIIRYYQREEGASIPNKFKTGIFVAIAMLCIILAILLVPLVEQKSGPEAGSESLIREFNGAFRDVEASFPQQTTRFWRILRNRAAAHLKNPNPKKPLVFMFTAPPSAHNVLGCIASKFARSLNYKDKGMGLIDSSDYNGYTSPDGTKKALDEKIKENLENGQTLLVLDVDRLPVKCPLLFYEYCDNENAPYTRAAIIFTVRLPSEPDPSLTPAKTEGLVAQYLRETWGKQDYKMDDVPPLVARMTDSVVMVKEESDETVQRNCVT